MFNLHEFLILLRLLLLLAMLLWRLLMLWLLKISLAHQAILVRLFRVRIHLRTLLKHGIIWKQGMENRLVLRNSIKTRITPLRTGAGVVVGSLALPSFWGRFDLWISVLFLRCCALSSNFWVYIPILLSAIVVFWILLDWSNEVVTNKHLFICDWQRIRIKLFCGGVQKAIDAK